MQWVWNGLCFLGLVVLVFAPAVAALLVKTSRRVTTLLLAALLTAEGITWGSGIGLIHFMGDRSDAVQAQAIWISGLIALPAIYLLFIAQLETRLVRWLRPWPVAVAIVAGTIGLEAYWLTHVPLFIPRMVHPGYAVWEAEIGPGGVLALAGVGAASLFAFVASIFAYRRAPKGSLAKQRAKWYIIAFGTHDLFGFAVFLLLPALGAPLPPSGTWWDAFNMLSIPAVILVFIGLLGYGILRTQLFDLDIKIRWTISRGVLAATFIAAFFVVSQVAQNYLTSTYGVLLGGVAAGLLLFAISPLQRVADHLAGRAVPAATGTPEYFAYRKLVVYRSALEEAMAHGGPSARDEAMLSRLARELQVSAEDCARVREDLHLLHGVEPRIVPDTRDADVATR